MAAHRRRWSGASGAPRAALNRYPDPAASRLLRTAHRRPHDVAAGSVTAVGNGSCEILLAAAEALLEPGAELVYAWPSFSMYPHLDGAVRRARDPGPARRGRAVTTSTRWRRRSRPRPGWCWSATRTTRRRPRCPSPTSTRSSPACRATSRDPRRGLRRVQRSSRTRRTRSTCSQRHPNLVVLRTFSKVYGLCGLRVGYALGSEEFRLAVDRVRQPFSVNALAQAAAAEAIAPPGRGRAPRRGDDRRAGARRVRARRTRASRRPIAGELRLGRARRARGGRGRRRARRARRDRARRRGARRGGAPARHLRHAARRTTASSQRSTKCFRTAPRPATNQLDAAHSQPSSPA